MQFDVDPGGAHAGLRGFVGAPHPSAQPHPGVVHRGAAQFAEDSGSDQAVVRVDVYAQPQRLGQRGRDLFSCRGVDQRGQQRTG